LERYAASGPGTVLVNSMLLTEGYDDPATDCVVVLRPTKSRPLYAQIVGRGTRIHPGKDHLLLLDFLWMTDRHDLCHPASLLAETPEEVEAMTEAQERAGTDGMEIDDAALAEAQGETMRKREEALAKKLEEMRRKKARLVDPLQYAMSIESFDVATYEPTFDTERGPVTPDQAKKLEEYGINPDGATSTGQAARLLAAAGARAAAGFATPKQIRCLERFGFRHVGAYQYAEANKLITRIAGNGWRVPSGLVRQINDAKTKERT
jgi:hypothetical protein